MKTRKETAGERARIKLGLSPLQPGEADAASGEGAGINLNAQVVHDVSLPARSLKKCCQNPNLPAALVPGFCALKFCERPQLLTKRRLRRRRENVERVRI